MAPFRSRGYTSLNAHAKAPRHLTAISRWSPALIEAIDLRQEMRAAIMNTDGRVEDDEIIGED